MSKILLAEDDEMMRTFLAASLKRAGHDVQDFEDGETALVALEREVFDLLLTDIVMPEMDGIELAQHCARIAPETRVMFITGFAAVALKAEDAAPQARILSKPFHLKDLVLEVDRVFERGEFVSIN